MVKLRKKAGPPVLRPSGPYKHVIFDWAGTLCDDQYASYLTTKQQIREMSGRHISFKQYKEHFTLPVLPFYRRYGVKLSLKKINDSFFKAYEENVFKSRLFDGVLPVLKELKKQKISASIFSTLDQVLLEALCDKFKIRKYFIKIEGSVCDKTKELKRHLKEIKRAPKDVMFMGDTDHDVEAANLDGCVSGCVFNGYQPKERLLKAKPQYVWNNQTEWLVFFKSFNQPYKDRKKELPKMPIATTGALIFNDKEEALFVLTHKWGHTYGIPGGKIDFNEEVLEATKREILEETGLKIKVGELVMVQDCINPPEFYKKNQHFLLFNYKAKALTKKVSLNNEALSYVWLKPKDAWCLNLNEPTRHLLSSLRGALATWQSPCNICGSNKSTKSFQEIATG